MKTVHKINDFKVVRTTFLTVTPVSLFEMRESYRKNPKNLDTQKTAVIILKLEQNCFTADELVQKM